ncbi:MAG: hypothetical protein P0Y55_04385 [Candidatus Cohnella colombiensis]|uniref:Uncharacterized protein n=1 Tax=Candidatus Cohnella colombiensis TaxID=3121368 RepID=A0AA95EYX9_9BACL|nr:MAG: hypothetical protein P0Y55_04385 [Cohnella sp.]
MATWSALFKKDLRLIKTTFLIGLVINLLCLLFAMLVNQYLFIPLLVAALFHVFYVPIILFISLKTEANQLHLWLHNPRSGATLLLSKVLNGIVMTIVSLLVLYVMAGSLVSSRFSLVEAYWSDAKRMGLFIFPHIIMLSILIGIWTLLLWSLYHAFKYRIGRWTWLALISAVIVLGLINELLDSSNLFKWGGWNIQFPEFSIDPISVYTGQYLYHFIAGISLFYLSSWIIDKKVEV